MKNHPIPTFLPTVKGNSRSAVSASSGKVEKPLSLLTRLWTFLAPNTLSLLRRLILFNIILLAFLSISAFLATRDILYLQNQIRRIQRLELAKHPPSPAIQEKIETLEARGELLTERIQWIFVANLLGIAFLVYCGGAHLILDRRERRLHERKLRRMNERLAQMVEADGLTGLKNRRAFEQRLQEEWERNRRYGQALSLLLLDVDHFKSYNDSFGHLAGDVALKLVGEILLRQSRVSDFAARYGGEEFVILLPHTGESAAVIAAERIRLAFLSKQWPERPVTVSIGAATVTPEMHEPTQLVNEADLALYYAKHLGRNRIMHAHNTVANEPLVKT